MARRQTLIDPVAFSLGPIHIHWYGLMYLLGFIGAYLLGLYRIRYKTAPLTAAQLNDFIFVWMVLGVVLGGRVGYVIFYQWSYFIHHPFYLFEIWGGGMSFHGGMLGVGLSAWLYARKEKVCVWDLTDMAALMVPIGLGLGRLGNFINGELWGRVTDVPWGMVFPAAGALPRHPSALYEAGLEGVVLGVLLWIYARKPRATGTVTGLFLILYGTFRFGIEMLREPDAHLGFLAFGFTLGQWLCVPMILLGAFFMTRQERTTCNNT